MEDVMEISIKWVNDSFFTTYLWPILTTVIGVIVGGGITLKINSYQNREKLRLDLRIRLWNNISNDMIDISNLLVKFDEYIYKYQLNMIVWDDLLDDIKANINEINTIFCKVRSQLSISMLIASDLANCTEQFDDQLEFVHQYLDDLRNDESLDNSERVKMHMTTFISVYKYLYWDLQRKLLSGLYTEKGIQKSLEKVDKYNTN